MKFVLANEENSTLCQAVLLQNDLCFLSLES